jgi:hypothetical protein
MKKLSSTLLGESIHVRVTTRALRTIKKYGGLDTYLAKRDSKILGKWGRDLRNEMGEVMRNSKAFRDAENRRTRLLHKELLESRKAFNSEVVQQAEESDVADSIANLKVSEDEPPLTPEILFTPLGLKVYKRLNGESPLPGE